VIPFLDVGASYRELQPEIDEVLHGVLAAGQFVLGPEVEAFESEFASYVGAEHCVGVASGYDALFLSLVALGIGPGDDVIVPSNTFIATWLAVSKAGARPVPVEPDLDTMNISLPAIESAVKSSTKAVLPVHLYGYPVDLEPVLDYCRQRGLSVIEDAAQAHGTVRDQKRIGAHSDAVAWSFYPGKNLGAFGDGGAVTTSDAEVAAKLRMLRNYGSTRKNEHLSAGFNSRLDEVQAAVLRVKLRHLDNWNARRHRQSARYGESLSGSDLVLPPPNSPSASPSWHLFVVRHPRRDDLQARLAEAGVATQIHYPTPPHLQPAYRSLGFGPGAFPVSEALASTVLSLPIGPHMTDDDQGIIIGALRSALPRLVRH
jgi:dTDP-4-amino-4,6-dideoxygalactose transaminase